MTSCRCQGTEEQFGREWARSALKRYHRRGPEKTSRLLLKAIGASGLRDASLLDIGGGIGAIHHELLDAGASTAIHVDASSALLSEAREEAGRRGHADRVDFVHGDFVDVAGELPSSDVVTMARVVCCYPDYEPLIALSARKAKRWFGISYPRDRWYVRSAMALGNVLQRLRGKAFRSFVHPVSEMEALIEESGFESRSARDTFFWRVNLYARTAKAGDTTLGAGGTTTTHAGRPRRGGPRPRGSPRGSPLTMMDSAGTVDRCPISPPLPAATTRRRSATSSSGPPSFNGHSPARRTRRD